jgi:hypothetical protein
MGAIIQGAGASELRWDAQWLVIRLPRRVFGAMWDTLVARLTEVRQSRAFIAWTQPAMTVRGSEPDAPRWKVHPLDVLSGLLFLLKVPTSHELVRLWRLIDWSTINTVCAPLYHNAHGGPHAWAPAQMIALLVLVLRVWIVRPVAGSQFAVHFPQAAGGRDVRAGADYRGTGLH